MDLVKLKKQSSLNFLIVFLLITCSCKNKVSQIQLQDQLGLNMSLKNEVFYWETGEDLQGEGFEISIYNYETNTQKGLIKKNYPLLQEDKNNFSLSTWKTTPISSQDFEIIFDYYTKNKDVEGHLTYLREILGKSGNHYAYYYKYANDTNIINAIELYVVDSTKKQFYIVKVSV